MLTDFEPVLFRTLRCCDWADRCPDVLQRQPSSKALAQDFFAAELRPSQIGQTVKRRSLARLPPPVGGGRCRFKNGAYFCCGLSPGFAGLFFGWVLGAVAIFRYSRLQRSTPCRTWAQVSRGTAIPQRSFPVRRVAFGPLCKNWPSNSKTIS